MSLYRSMIVYENCSWLNVYRLLGSRVQGGEDQLFLSGLKVSVPSIPVRLPRVLQRAVTSSVLNKQKVGAMRKHQVNQLFVGFGGPEGIVKGSASGIIMNVDRHANLIDQKVNHRDQSLTAGQMHQGFAKLVTALEVASLLVEGTKLIHISLANGRQHFKVPCFQIFGHDFKEFFNLLIGMALGCEALFGSDRLKRLLGVLGGFAQAFGKGGKHSDHFPRWKGSGDSVRNVTRGNITRSLSLEAHGSLHGAGGVMASHMLRFVRLIFVFCLI
jgi:hypothetical protein